MFVSGWFPLPSLPYYESLVSVKENTDRKSIKEERKKNTDRTQTKLDWKIFDREIFQKLKKYMFFKKKKKKKYK